MSRVAMPSRTASGARKLVDADLLLAIRDSCGLFEFKDVGGLMRWKLRTRSWNSFVELWSCESMQTSSIMGPKPLAGGRSAR